MITILTPTYNRASLLPRLYASLCRQTCQDFEWIVVDDGSTDNTPQLFSAEEGPVPILKQCSIHLSAIGTLPEVGHRGLPCTDCLEEMRRGHFPQEGTAPAPALTYIRKPNGGKHTAVNLGVQYANGELTLILDSDDELPPDSVEIIAEEWRQVRDNPMMAGVAGLDVDRHELTVIGSGLPKASVDCNAMEIRYRWKVTGDLKEVFRTSVLRAFPFPETAGERFCPEQLVWFRIAQQYQLHYFNRPVYIADYQTDGLSAGITRARMGSPRGAMLTYTELTAYRVPVLVKFKAAVNYWRFWYCRRADTVIPPIAWWWHGLRPLGWLMHRHDVSTSAGRPPWGTLQAMLQPM